MLVGAVLCAQLFSPTSMLSAMRRVEYLQLMPSNDATPARRRAHRGDWNEVAAARDTALGGHPHQARHFALRRLLRLLLDVQRGRQDARTAVDSARQLAAADPDNLIARLAHAAVADLRAADNAVARSPIDRFDAMRGIIEADPPADRVTLYNTEFTQTWRDVLARYLQRPDVATSLAASTPHYLITDHYAALPVIRERLVNLAGALRADGHAAAADTCLRWVARLALGLIDAESDAGTRLLAADLLAGAISRPSPTSERARNGDAARHLRELRPHFHTRAAAAPIDLCDQSFSPRPAVDADAYNTAFRRLVLACVLGLVACGGAALFVVACLGSLLRTAIRRGGGQTASEKRSPWYVKPVIALFSSFALVLLIIAAIAAHGIHSQAWVFTVGAGAITAGAAIAVVVAGLSIITDQIAARRRLALSSIPALAAVLIGAVPPPLVTQGYRSVDLVVPAAWVILFVSIVLVLGATVLSPARLRTIAAAAAVVGCLNLVAACAVYPFHRLADRHYQQAVLAGRLDEVTARLGPDWQEVYLAPTGKAFLNPPD